jgi:hypothetical protein
MIRWLFVIFIGLTLFSALIPELTKLGVGRLPGDMRVKLFGRILLLPFGSTVLVFLLVLLVAELQK